MSEFDWKEHAECPYASGEVDEPLTRCNEDRSLMIAEGESLAEICKTVSSYAMRMDAKVEKLEAENARFADFLKAADSNHAHWKEQALNLEAENARLREALEEVIRVEKTRLEFPAGGYATFTASTGEWKGIVTKARAALSGDKP